MDNEEKKPKQPEKPAPAPEAVKAGKMKSPAAKEARPRSRFSRFLRRTAFALGYAALLLGIGAAGAVFLIQRPQVSALETQISTLETEKADLEAENASLESRVAALEPLEDENESLQASLAGETLHTSLLSALKDVQAAQLALSAGDADSARLNLSRTEAKLDGLSAQLPADQQGVVTGMSQRLELALAGLDEDGFAAQSDLEVLANSLIQLEATLFVEP